MDLEELRQATAAAKERRERAALSEEETERAKLLAELAEHTEAARAEEKARRDLEGAKLEAVERQKAGGKYLVRYVSVGDLLPDADPATLPGAGILIVRSPPTHPVNVLDDFYREVEAKANGRALPDIYADLVCQSTVYPSTDGAAGAKLRAFFESSIGRGTVTVIGDQVTDLGGVRNKAIKRGRG